MLRRKVTENTGYLRRTRQEGPVRELSEGSLSYANLGYAGKKKIKFSGVDAGEAITPAAVKAFEKYLRGIGVKPALAKKLAAHNESNIDSALSRVRFEAPSSIPRAL